MTAGDAVLAELGALLAYPRGGVPERARDLAERLAGSGPGGALAALRAFADELAGADAGTIEEIYTRTFDIAPLCAPYLSVHLFGEESMHRPRLMTGLAQALQRAGVAYGGELPDHVAIVLRASESLPPADWDELARLAVMPALAVMCDRTAPSTSPYRHALAAALALVAAQAGLSPDQARALRRPLVVLPGNVPGCSGAPPVSEMTND